MTEDEAAALAALRAYALRVQEYNDMIYESNVDYSSRDYIEAANARVTETTRSGARTQRLNSSNGDHDN